MREIKFRIFDKQFNKFIYPYDVHINAGTGKAKGVKGGYGYVDTWEINQFTGLKDKNGVEIYEGDIVETADSMATISVSSVSWNNENATFWLDAWDEWLGDTTDDLEIIGNIYEDENSLSD